MCRSREITLRARANKSNISQAFVSLPVTFNQETSSTREIQETFKPHGICNHNNLLFSWICVRLVLLLSTCWPVRQVGLPGSKHQGLIPEEASLSTMDLQYAVQILISLLIISVCLLILLTAMICTSYYQTRPTIIRLREENQTELELANQN